MEAQQFEAQFREACLLLDESVARLVDLAVKEEQGGGFLEDQTDFAEAYAYHLYPVSLIPDWIHPVLAGLPVVEGTWLDLPTLLGEDEQLDDFAAADLADRVQAHAAVLWRAEREFLAALSRERRPLSALVVLPQLDEAARKETLKHLQQLIDRFPGYAAGANPHQLRSGVSFRLLKELIALLHEWGWPVEQPR